MPLAMGDYTLLLVRRILIAAFLAALLTIPLAAILYAALGTVATGLGVIAALFAIQLPVLIWLQRRGQLNREPKDDG